MNGRRSFFLCALPLLFAGCHNCGTQSCYPPAPVVGSAGYLPAHPLTPCQSCQVPTGPPGVIVNPPAPIPPPTDSGFHPMPSGPVQQAWGPAGPPPSANRGVPVTPLPERQQGSAPSQQAWGPVSPPPSANPGVPVPPLPERQRESARISTPESPEPPKAPPAEMPREPEAGVKPRPSPSLPAGIANFAEAVPGVATGLRPELDGIDWLKTNEYKVALQVRTPGENVDGDRKLFEQKGLKYLSLEVSPKTLTPQIVGEFNQIATEPGHRPLFVYDKDGSLAGALWYLHFRTAGKLSDEEARRKAAALGLKEDADSQREMWLAVQNFLAEQEKK
jgi:protein tyrosine phosphatase (PTP) superfamily phosphohydrolase (DUF442 family)